jgi:translation elongation factor EF-Ts
MKQRFKDYPDTCYSVELFLLGTEEQFSALLEEPIIIDFLDKNLMSAEFVLANLINAANYEEMSSGDTQLATLLNSNDHVRNALYARIQRIEDSLKTTKKTSMKKEDRIRETIEKYLKLGTKLLDVSGWDQQTHSGYKTIARPQGTRSRNAKKCLNSLPICSHSVERLAQFLDYLDYDSETLMKEVDV